jgi:hypothetical protein
LILSGYGFIIGKINKSTRFFWWSGFVPMESFICQKWQPEAWDHENLLERRVSLWQMES